MARSQERENSSTSVETTGHLSVRALRFDEDLANLGGDFEVSSGVNEKGPHRSTCRRQIPVASGGLIAVAVESHS